MLGFLQGLRKNNWSVPRLTVADLTVLVGTFVTVGYLRSFDYLYGQDSAPIRPIDGRPPTVFLLSEIVPLNVYGAMLGVFLTLLLAGWLLRWHQMIWWGHGLSWVMYLILFVGTLLPIFQVPYFDGLRGATSLVTPAVMHFLLWMRMGPTPLPHGEDGWRKKN